MIVGSKKKILQSVDKVQGGQALVLVLLSLAVVVTIVLFVLSRSVTDIAVSDNESQAVNAFSAAEAGVEQALVIGSNIPQTNIGEASYNAQITNVASGATGFTYPIELNSGDIATVWFKSQDASPSFTGSTLRVCWGKTGTSSGTATTPAVEISVFYQTVANSPANTRIRRFAVDPYTGPSRSQPNSFDPSGPGSTIAGRTFPFCTTLNLSTLSNLQFATVRMFYNTNTSHPIGFDSTNASTFPSQGIVVNSTGNSGQSSRKVQVFQSWPEIPSMFLYGLFSPVGLTK